jgi:hypothetical protein
MLRLAVQIRRLWCMRYFIRCVAFRAREDIVGGYVYEEDGAR